MDNKLAQSMADLEKLFGSRMQDYEDKLLKIAAGSAPKHLDLASLSSEFIEFKSFVCHSLTLLKAQIELVSRALDKHETAMRRKILLFHGIPEKANEKVNETVLDVVVKRMKLDDACLDMFEVCHRLGASQAKTRPVLVRFKDMEHRRVLWDSKTSLKGSGISEFLTKTRHQVFVAARKHFGISSCWSAEGKIIVQAADKSRRKISSLGELDDLIALFPARVSAATAGGSALPSVASISPKADAKKAKVLRKTRR
ncbi:hypothetical protein B5X24_HaOG206404 [Helicoverpa armigera]|uniref:Uncharacterized protein n=1 Tax=Helicoverpa armigera TaxID=29058 RepID=A0A2W1BPW3_HELAM|nr:hypothetical protein B5X24_HaOG206404 [Helicoverpa armigera]